jgi:putative ABC transport system permease protein
VVKHEVAQPSRFSSPMRRLLTSFSWQELRHHPWRNAAAVVAVMLGVALAFSVHLINASALTEFARAVRSVNGQPDLSLRAVSSGFDEALYGELARHPSIQAITPVVEISTYAVTDSGEKQALRVLGVDALTLGSINPEVIPVPAPMEGGDIADTDHRLSIFAPDAVFLNTSARQLISSKPPAFGNTATAGDAPLVGNAKRERLYLQSGLRVLEFQVAGHVTSGGPALVVMDIGAVQEQFGKLGILSRIDLTLIPGADRAAFLRDAALLTGFAGKVTVVEPGDMDQRIHSMSSAYRVNLTVLSLVALFTGAFLVFSVLALSVAKRAQQFALLGVLGLTPGERLRLVLYESFMLGSFGSLLGLALGTGLASLALHVLGGDLGGGYFSASSPPLQWSLEAASVYGLLGVLAALAGGWWPARQAQQMPPAQTLKGLGIQAPLSWRHHIVSMSLIALAGGLAMVPPIGGLPLAAYASVALLLMGGINSLPMLVASVYGAISPLLNGTLLPLLAVERARRQRQTAAVAISGVVASLSLAVALTVMVTSFRQSVSDWLGQVLPADLYVRTAKSASASDAAFLGPELVQGIGELKGITKVAPVRIVSLQLSPIQPPVTLIARPLHGPQSTAQAPKPNLPLLGLALPLPAEAKEAVPLYISEAMADLYRLKLGGYFNPAKAFKLEGSGSLAPVLGANYFVAGIWRDYARQHGSMAIDTTDFVRLSGDTRINDLALWLAQDSSATEMQNRIRKLAEEFSLIENKAGNTVGGDTAQLLEFATTAQLRDVSLQIFDRTFAVTYWLQAVAIAIGLFGVAASFSAQALARRKEFGLLTHLGLTRTQILQLVAGEGLVWTGIGAAAGLLLGIAVAVVLVHVINPQSFHWTMEMVLPWIRLSLLCLAVVVAGTLTAWLAGRAAAGQDAVLAVKEDW